MRPARIRPHGKCSRAEWPRMLYLRTGTSAHLVYMEQEMKNIEMKVEKNVLTIRVDLKKEFGKSKSGKSLVIASTEGNTSVEGTDGVKIGLNVYRSAG